MASSDITGLYIFGFIILLIIAFVAYAFLSKRRTDARRREMIRAFRASPRFVKDAPALVQGTAAAPDLVLPTTGERVAYYSLFVLSRETSIRDTRTAARVRIDGIGFGGSEHIDSVRGFQFFETSGDFTVVSSGGYYFVRPAGIYAYFKQGFDTVGRDFVRDQFIRMGMPAGILDDALYIPIAQQALKMLCGFEAPIVTERSRHFSSGGLNKRTTTAHAILSVSTVTSRIDSRIHNFMAGYNLPQGIADRIAKRGIALGEKEEVIVVETYIPLNKEVFVFGTFDGGQNIAFADGTVQLSVTYDDPALT